MLSKMTRLFLCLGFLLLGTSSLLQAQTDPDVCRAVTAVIAEAKQQFAPDQRTKIVALVESDSATNSYLIESSVPEATAYIQSKTDNLPATIRIQSLPDSSVADKNYGIVKLSVANFRSKPGHSSEMATQALLGTQVDLLQKVGSEYRARTPEGYISYVPVSALAPMDQSELTAWKERPKIIFTADFGKSWSKPDPESIRVSDLVYGNILGFLGEQGDYYQVMYPDGREGYVLKQEALRMDEWLSSRALTPENLISSAKTMMGLPYLWGGTSVKGVDCSGFTKTIYYMNGYIIPRDASQQVLAGEDVDILDEEGDFSPEKALKNLKPADLLFFAAGKNSDPNARVTHVALYIGQGEFIHSAGTVRINSMLKDADNYDDFQTRTVVAAKRYIDSPDQQIQKIQENPYY